MVRRLLPALLLAVCAGFTLTGCAGEVTGNEYSPYDAREPEPEPDLDRLAAQSDRYIEEQMAVWTCEYAPTNDRNWHNDVLCTNGAESERPYLLPNDSYITPDEMEAAAYEHQGYLNGDTPNADRGDTGSGGYENSELEQWVKGATDDY